MQNKDSSDSLHSTVRHLLSGLGKMACNIWLGKEKMEEVNEFKYLGTILCKHGSMEVGWGVVWWNG